MLRARTRPAPSRSKQRDSGPHSCCRSCLSCPLRLGIAWLFLSVLAGVFVHCHFVGLRFRSSFLEVLFGIDVASTHAMLMPGITNALAVSRISHAHNVM